MLPEELNDFNVGPAIIKDLSMALLTYPKEDWGAFIEWLESEIQRRKADTASREAAHANKRAQDVYEDSRRDLTEALIVEQAARKKIKGDKFDAFLKKIASEREDCE